MEYMSKITRVILILSTITVLLLKTAIVFGIPFACEPSNHWKLTPKAEYPELVVKGSNNNEPIKLWESEKYLGSGELAKRWKVEIPFNHEFKYHEFNNTPQGWLYVCSEKKPDSEKIQAVYGDYYQNYLIKPETGVVKLLEPRFSLFSHVRTNIKICDSPYDGKDKERPKDIRCYDIDKNKVIWHIRDTRKGQAGVQPFLPVQLSKNMLYYVNNGITRIDGQTGEILKSLDYKILKDGDSYIKPGIRGILITDDYLWLDGYYQKQIIYKMKPNLSEIRECSAKELHNFALLVDNKHIWFRYSSYINIFRIRDFEHEKYLPLHNVVWDKYSKDVIGVYSVYAYHPLVSNFLPFTIYSVSETDRKIKHPFSEEWNSGINLVDPFYECDTYQFLLNRDDLTELVELSPALTGSKKTYMQSIDGEIVIQTVDEIMCFDIEKLEKKWTIDKSDFDNPERAEVYAVYWRGVLVRDVNDEKIAKFYCYDVPPPEPISIVGTVTWVDCESGNVAVTTSSDTFTVELPEAFTKDGEAATCDDLEVGDLATVTGIEGEDGSIDADVAAFDSPSEPEPTPEPPRQTETILMFQIGVKKQWLDGDERLIDVAPLILNGRTFLPARSVTEPLGGDVLWDGVEKKVICKLEATNTSLEDGSENETTYNTVEFWIGKPTARVNGVEIQIDPDNPEVVPTIIDGRTMVPMRFLAESLGCEVEWIAETKEIILTYSP